MWSVSSASFLIIGSELLSGKVQELNLKPLADTLRRRGVQLMQSRIVPDDVAHIVDAVTQLSDATDIVFTSGGIGPTHDDVTMDAIARAFGTTVHCHPRLLSLLRTVYGENLSGEQQRLARVPVTARLVEPQASSDDWPGIVVKNVWILPGVPQLFRSKLRLVREHVSSPDKPWVSAEVGCLSDEFELKALIDQTVQDFPEIDVGSYPKWFGSKIRTLVTFDGRDATQVKAAEADFVRRLKAHKLQFLD